MEWYEESGYSEKELSSIQFPTTLKGKELMAPGTWNDDNYSANDIEEAFANTNWGDKDNISLFLDHEDRRTSKWVGWIKNPRILKGEGRIIGDLELWDEQTIRNLVHAKAKFGVSPKVGGKEGGNAFTNFTFKNFSIVTRPAVRTAYINLIKNEEGGFKQIKMAEEEENNKPEGEIENENNEAGKEDPNQPKKTPEEEEGKDTEPYKEKKDAVKKKKPEEEEEMSDDELLEITQLSAWTDFVKKTRKKHPKMPFKAIAAAYKKQKKSSEDLEELNDVEIVEKIDELMSVLKLRKKYPEDEEEDEGKKEMKVLAEKVKELQEKINEPDSKTLALKQSNEVSQLVPGYSPGVVGMADWINKNIGGISR